MLPSVVVRLYSAARAADAAGTFSSESKAARPEATSRLEARAKRGVVAAGGGAPSRWSYLLCGGSSWPDLKAARLAIAWAAIRLLCLPASHQD